MISVFEYTDSKKYLEDYYKERKNENIGFSYQQIATKAGFNSKGYVYNFLNGKRRLSRTNCIKLSRALNHNKYEAEYFENLVSFSQTSGLKEKNYFFEKMNRIKERGKKYAPAHIIEKDQYEFYSTWYHSAIRSLIGMYEFKNDYRWLSRMVTPHITARQARKSVLLLDSLGLIARRADGTYTITHKSITTGKEVKGLAVRNFQYDCADLAKNTISDLSKENRNITGLTLGISEQSYRRICEEIVYFQEKIMEIANSDDDADRVFQLNFHFFPLSKKDVNHRRIP